jgi:GT2 family glycosyltransferase
MAAVVVITINYKQNKYTINCINSLLTSRYTDFNIILLDNGPSSEDHSELKKSLPDDKRVNLHLSEKNIGYVRGINYGLMEAYKFDPEYIMILNNDTYVDENSMGELVKTCQMYQNKAIVTGKVYNYDNKLKIQNLGFKFINKNNLKFISIGNNEKDDRGLYENIEERDIIDDQFWLFPFRLYKEIGGYSEYFYWAYEQADFALRAKSADYKLIYTPKAHLWHRVHGALSNSEYNAAYCYWDTQSELIFKFMHTQLRYFLFIYFSFCVRIVRVFTKTIFFYFTGKGNIFKYAFAKLFGFLYFNKWILLRNINNGKNPFL